MGCAKGCAEGDTGRTAGWTGTRGRTGLSREAKACGRENGTIGAGHNEILCGKPRCGGIQVWRENQKRHGDDVVRHAVRCGRTVWSITLRKTMKKTQERSMTSSIRGFSSQHSKAISEAAATLDATENTEADKERKRIWDTEKRKTTKNKRQDESTSASPQTMPP